MDDGLKNMPLLSSQELTDGLEWLWIIVFISCLDSHSDWHPFTAEHHCGDTDAETHFYKPDEETNSL